MENNVLGIVTDVSENGLEIVMTLNKPISKDLKVHVDADSVLYVKSPNIEDGVDGEFKLHSGFDFSLGDVNVSEQAIKILLPRPPKQPATELNVAFNY